MANEAGRKRELKLFQLSPRDQIETNHRTIRPSDSSQPEFAEDKQLHISLFGLSRKLLALNVLVKSLNNVLEETVSMETNGNATKMREVVNLSNQCVKRICQVRTGWASRMQNLHLKF
jgi:hypothetical protein